MLASWLCCPASPCPGLWLVPGAPRGSHSGLALRLCALSSLPRTLGPSPREHCFPGLAQVPGQSPRCSLMLGTGCGEWRREPSGQPCPLDPPLLNPGTLACFPPLQVTEDVHRLLRRGTYRFVCRGKVSVKGKGEMLTYFLEGRTDANGSQARSLNAERKMCAYGRAGLQTRLATGPPPVGPMIGHPVRAGLGSLQGSGLPPGPHGQHPPPGAAGKEA